MNRKNSTIIIFIFASVIIICGVSLKFLPAFPVVSDAADYDIIAQNLMRGKGFVLEEGVPTALRPPAYPFFLSIIYKIFGRNLDLVRIIQFLILAGMAIIVYFFALEHLKLPPLFAFLASATVAVWPYFILYSYLILTEVLFSFTFLFSIYFLLKFRENPATINYLLSGIFLGLAMLIRPHILLLPIWLLFLLYSRGIIKDFSFKKFIIFILVVYIVVSPWILRNFLELGQFIPIMEWPGLRKAYVTLDYIEGSTPLKPEEATLKTMLLARLKNIYLFWNPGAEGENAKILVEKYPPAKYFLWGYKVLFFVFLVLAFFSLKFVKRKKEVFLLWSIILYFWILHIFLFPYPRYTLPIIPLVIILAFYSISYLSSQYKQKYISR